MTCATGGCGWWGRIGADEHLVQKLLERYEIREGCYNAGSHNGLLIDSARREHRRWFWPHMRKSQIRKGADDMDVKPSVAKRFWDIVRVYYRWMIKIGHGVIHS